MAFDNGVTDLGVSEPQPAGVSTSPTVPADPNVKAPPRFIPDAELATMVTRYREEAYERDYVIRDRWLQCYALYRNKADFSDKAPWQSRLMFSKAFAAVKQATANIIRLLLTSEQWVTVEPGDANPNLDLLAQIVEHIVLKLAGTADARVSVRDALDFAFAIGLGVIKVDWRYDIRNDLSIEPGRDGSSETPQLIQKQRNEGHLALTSVDPFHMWFGPRSKGKRDFDWTIEESYADLAALKASGGFVNLDKVTGSTLDQSDMTRSYEKARKDKRETPEASRKSVHLMEYYGDIVDRATDEIVQTNQHVIVANRTHVIKREDNPYWDRTSPYIAFSPLIVAGRFPGQGVLEMSLSLLTENNKVAQQMADHMSFSVVPMLEVEATALENPEGDMQTGIQPGKVFYKRSGGQTAVTGVNMPQLSGASFNFQSALDHEIQRSTFISETVQGLTDTKGETTATEINATQMQSSVLISDIGNTLEDMLLAPLAEAIWSRAFQFIDSTTKPTWTELVGQDYGPIVDRMPREQRILLLQGRYNFTAHGLSRAIQRQQNAGKILSMLQTISQGGQQFIGYLNVAKIFQRYFDALHLPDAADLLSANAPEFAAAHQAAILSDNPVAQEHARTAGRAHTEAAKDHNSTLQQLLKAHLAQPQFQPQQQQPPPPKQTAPTLQISFKDLTPAERAQALAQVHIQADPNPAAVPPAPATKVA